MYVGGCVRVVCLRAFRVRFPFCLDAERVVGRVPNPKRAERLASQLGTSLPACLHQGSHTFPIREQGCMLVTLWCFSGNRHEFVAVLLGIKHKAQSLTLAQTHSISDSVAKTLTQSASKLYIFELTH